MKISVEDSKQSCKSSSFRDTCLLEKLKDIEKIQFIENRVFERDLHCQTFIKGYEDQVITKTTLIKEVSRVKKQLPVFDLPLLTTTILQVFSTHIDRPQYHGSM